MHQGQAEHALAVDESPMLFVVGEQAEHALAVAVVEVLLISRQYKPKKSHHVG